MIRALLYFSSVYLSRLRNTLYAVRWDTDAPAHVQGTLAERGFPCTLCIASSGVTSNEATEALASVKFLDVQTS